MGLIGFSIATKRRYKESQGLLCSIRLRTVLSTMSHFYGGKAKTSEVRSAWPLILVVIGPGSSTAIVLMPSVLLHTISVLPNDGRSRPDTSERARVGEVLQQGPRARQEFCGHEQVVHGRPKQSSTRVEKRL